MGDSSRSEADRAMYRQADVMFGREVTKLVRVHRGLTERNPDPGQANADVLAYVAKEYPLDVLAALLAQAVNRIVDLEDLASL